MHTRQIAAALAHAALGFPCLGEVTQEALLSLVAVELGHVDALMDFQPSGTSGRHSRAVAPSNILHIVSGNTPHAGLQSVIRGLLLGTRNNWCKIPSTGLPELAEFQQRLPTELASRMEISSNLPARWLSEASAIIVFGSDETIEHFRRQARGDQVFLAHGHRFSFGVVFEDAALESAPAAARDASLFDQQGCLSPHVIFVQPEIARAYAERLAEEMACFEAHTPRGALSVEEKAAVMRVRGEFAFRASVEPGVALWQSEGSTAWTVLLEREASFVPSSLNRVIRVVPCPAEGLVSALAAVRPHLSTAGIFPATLENARLAAAAGARRVCELGQMQYPPVAWHQDGMPVLGALVSYVDLELPVGDR